MKKGFLLLLILIASVAAIGSAQATPYAGVILSAEEGNIFGVSQDDTFIWNTSWSGSPFNTWVSALSLAIPVGGSYVFTKDQDVDLGSGFPMLHFSNFIFDGVDFLAANIDLDGDEDGILYALTTNTPLPGEGLPTDWTTFSIFTHTAPYGGYAFFQAQMELTPIITGQLFFEPVPEPSTLLLLGVGLMGFLACFRKRAQ